MSEIKPLRKAEEYGDVRLSVQASQYHYCSPRIDELDFDNYASYEIAVMHGRHMVLPSAVGVDGYDHLFEEGGSPVAGYVPRETVDAIRAALTARAEKGGAA